MRGWVAHRRGPLPVTSGLKPKECIVLAGRGGPKRVWQADGMACAKPGDKRVGFRGRMEGTQCCWSGEDGGAGKG